MKDQIQLSLLVAVGVFAGSITYFQFYQNSISSLDAVPIADFKEARFDPAPINPVLVPKAGSTVSAAPDSKVVNAEASALRDEVFKAFPVDSWIRVPRGVMEYGEGIDPLLYVIGGGSADQLRVLHAMMPDASDQTVMAAASEISRFSQEWAKLAATSLVRSGPDQWQLNLPPQQLARLREEFEQNLKKLLGPGYSHVIKILTYKPMATLSEPSTALTYDSAHNRLILEQRHGDSLDSTNIDESVAGENPPVRLLFDRVRSQR